MTNSEQNATHRDPEPLLVSAAQAAKLLSVSEKTLWNHTTPRGKCIPAVRLGKTLRYDLDALRRWIARETNQSSANGSG